MSLCRLYSIHLKVGARPWTPPLRREKRLFFNIARASSSGRKERTSQSSSEGDDDDDGFPGRALWDSNVENLRRGRRRNNRNNNVDSAEEAPPDWLTPRKDWTFNSQEDQAGKKKPDEWWNSPKNEEESDEEEEEDDEDDDDEEDGSDQLFSSLRWGIPVSFIVLPWLLGNPVILLLGLAAVPAVQKAAAPVVSQVWDALLRLSGSKRRRKRDNFDFNADEEEEEEQQEDAYTSWGGERSNGQPYRYKRPAAPDDKYARPAPDERRVPAFSDEKAAAVSMGGWEDLEGDKSSRRVPVRRAKNKASSKLGWSRRSKRKEKPLLLRLLVALFPFLRNWGGWLSAVVFLAFPFLGSPFT